MEQTERTEVGMIHIIAKALRGDRLLPEDLQQVFFCNSISFSKLQSKVAGHHFINRKKAFPIHFPEEFLRLRPQFRHCFHIFVNNERSILPAIVIPGFKEGDHLLEGQFKRIADIMEQSCHSPVFQEEMGRFSGFSGMIRIRSEMIKTVKRPAEIFICFIDRNPQHEDIHRMGKVIPVLHQKRTAVGFIFAEQLYNLFRSSVASEKNFHKTVIDTVRILRCAGIHESLQFPLQAQPVDVHLHIVRNLVRRKACAAEGS